MKDLEVAAVRGCLRQNGEAVEGEIWFIPNKMWVRRNKEHYAVRSRRARLRDGTFCVHLTASTIPGTPIIYDVVTPFGTWQIECKAARNYQMSELMEKHKR